MGGGGEVWTLQGRETIQLWPTEDWNRFCVDEPLDASLERKANFKESRRCGLSVGESKNNVSRRVKRNSIFRVKQKWRSDAVDGLLERMNNISLEGVTGHEREASRTSRQAWMMSEVSCGSVA